MVSRNSTALTAIWAAIGWFALGSVSFAQSPSSMSSAQQAAIRDACGVDYRRYCPRLRPGSGRAIACLRDNGESLSPPCQRALLAEQR